MKPETYEALKRALQKIQKTLVASQIEAVRRTPELHERMTRLHAEAEVGGRLDDFIATAARKSTVLFLLRTVFVRALEDLGILGVKRIRDDWGFAAFREVAPALGKRDYFRFIFRDLAVDFPALFAPGDDELPLPDEDGCNAVWNLWHHPNAAGEHYVWDAEAFDSRFLGDLYQDLDTDIRKRYALLQTPRFVEEYILDHTLTPALAEFDPAQLRAKGETFRLLDPTCGSGHFLIGAFHRLADYWRDKHGLAEWTACERALESVWGCDINPHAVEIAEFRLLLEVVARTGMRDLERLAALNLNLRTMDSLIPWERALSQAELFPGSDRLDAYATPAQRRDNAGFLGRAFHAVVGNPPYITPKDPQKRRDYATFFPRSCFMNYALSAPFTERFFSMGTPSAHVGQLTASSFMKRQFGKGLIERYLPGIDLSCIVDTTGAYLPGHPTPTIIIFGRSRPPGHSRVRALLGKRGEPRRPQDPSTGFVWRAICEAGDQASDDNPFITVAWLSRDILGRHPWSMGGGESLQLLETLARNSTSRLAEIPNLDAGLMLITGEDAIYESSEQDALRAGIPKHAIRKLVNGDALRDFGVNEHRAVFLTNSTTSNAPISREDMEGGYQWLWRFRRQLQSRVVSGSTQMEDAGKLWYEVRRLSTAKFRGTSTIVFPLVSTHNHFILQHNEPICHHSAPVIKLDRDASAQAHHSLLGLLNSSTLAFWMKQVFHDKGSASEDWERRYEYDVTKLKQAPISATAEALRVKLSTAINDEALRRTYALPSSVLSRADWPTNGLGPSLSESRDHYASSTFRMVALQEELDWLTYASYGLTAAVPIVLPEEVEPLAPGHRPFEIVFARKDDEVEDEEKSAWWSRHGHDRVTEIPAHYSEAQRARIQERIDLIESDPCIALLETPPYKRRWQLVDWEAETKKAAESWLLDRLEDLFAPESDSTRRGPLAEPKAYRLEDIVVAWARHHRVAEVAGVWTGTGLSVDLSVVAEKLLRAHAIADNPHRVDSAEGQRKLKEWKRVWALQEQEDAWTKAKAETTERGDTPAKREFVDPDDAANTLDAIPLPPKFERQDFVNADLFSMRGKLNVPRERFILFAELSPPRYGWNGWRDRERALAQVEAVSLAENDPLVPLPAPTTDDPRRCGVTYGLWETLPDVRRWSTATDHAELYAFAKEACRQPRCPCPIVEAWSTRVLHGDTPAEPARAAKATIAAESKSAKAQAAAEKRAAKAQATNERKSAKKSTATLDAAPLSVEAAPTTTGPTFPVTLAERAWVVRLFEPKGADYDLATLWSRHRSRLAEPPQLTFPGLTGSRSQLTIPEFSGTKPEALTNFDEPRLALILDDLLASGDLEVRGRGKKKRYTLVQRGASR